MAPAPVHPHHPPGENRSRWLGFRFRPGDIVISTPPKSGTTWTQMICALLIFQTPDLPYPLWRLSPWLDSPDAPGDHIRAQLAAQRHRRFIKTHAPLAAIPSDPRVTYIVTARNPLDAFVSMYHQAAGFGPPPPPPGGTWPPPGAPPPPPPPQARGTLHDALVEWIGDDRDPPVYPESLRRTMEHLSGAWARRGEPNLVLVHYDDLLADLQGQMRWLAARLGIAVPQQSWPVLAEAATFERMRDREGVLVPPPPGPPPPGQPPPGPPPPGMNVAGTSAFFRRGTSGAGREILSEEELADYYAHAARLAPAGLFEWLHRPVMGR